MLELIKSGGWLMIPILLCSVIAMAIIAERLWALRRKKIVPKHLVAQIYNMRKKNQLDINAIQALKENSHLGRVLASGLMAMHNSREVMKENIEETGRHVVHEMEKYLNTLGTIAQIAPLLGLLGTVVGMIKVFTVITSQGVGNPGVLAGGISEALITTAAGLTVAIPALIAARYFRRHIDDLVIHMEQEAIKLVEVIHGQRDASAVESR
ncbi:MAG TPA: MotA/TolQ/ExbB proton channel family protein [Gammaproteobacteria bacterium]|nr:MotA/TolQ/ExbB proton channel family protein [Gammaproteobacteria bacterium]